MIFIMCPRMPIIGVLIIPGLRHPAHHTWLRHPAHHAGLHYVAQPALADHSGRNQSWAAGPAWVDSSAVARDSGVACADVVADGADRLGGLRGSAVKRLRPSPGIRRAVLQPRTAQQPLRSYKLQRSQWCPASASLVPRSAMAGPKTKNGRLRRQISSSPAKQHATVKRSSSGIGKTYAERGNRPARTNAAKVALPVREASSKGGRVAAVRVERTESTLLTPIENPSAIRLAIPRIKTMLEESAAPEILAMTTNVVTIPSFAP